jgi:NAD(P)-dependent dehydrogenase (short-subunit alcohol dehydrogenase family)
MSLRLATKTALVTGSTSGIGEAIAVAMAAEGALVVVTGRDAARGAAVVAAITAAGGRAAFVAADLAAGPAAIRALASEATEAAGGRLDVLVNNAAFLVGGRATVDTDADLIDAALSVSIKAPFLLTAAIVPAMVERGAGVIVNIGSINGVVGMNGAALYGATKAALHSLTKSWAAEFGPYGVRVNTVAPGPTLTAHNESIRDYLDDMLSTVPSRRPSTTAEVAAAAVFLASDDASNIHGATLAVDGGFTSR